MAASSRFGGLCAFGAAGLAFASAPLAYAEQPYCPTVSYRWEEDCSVLAGKDLTGLNRLRYLPVGPGWLTLSGEARVRIDAVDATDFGIRDAPDYVSFGRRMMFGADLHATRNLRVFGQLTVTDENGREPVQRPQDRDGPDVGQFFVDLPVHVGSALLVTRIGRQELNMEGNRLVSTRDGANIRRAFNGTLLMVSSGDVSINLFHLRPIRLRSGPFDDWPDPDETFDGATVDTNGLGAFVFDRTRPNARWLEGAGAERRWTSGLRHSWRDGAWRGYAQGVLQWGRTKSGQKARAAGAIATTTYTFKAPHDPRLIWTASYASGDGKRGDGVIETFDPIYPSNNGFSDSPLLYQTNYMYASGQGQMRFGPADLTASAFIVGRASTVDAIYAQGRPIDGTAIEGRLTAFILQTSAHLVPKRGTDIYSSVAYAFASDAVRRAGGGDVAYFRLQLTATF
ncbi:MAG TPA: alginate export family protein [Caulobacterales bacterium]|nr:alginate export family protein [Caulobacterales bacterium]